MRYTCLVISLSDYDDLLGVIYNAGAGRLSVGAMLCRLALAVEAAAAGFLVYGIDERIVTHSLVAPPPAVTPDLATHLRDVNDDPGPRALSRMSFRSVRRFTDVVPRQRLDNAGWFRRQAKLSGMGYGIGIDLDLRGVSVRLFCMRAAGNTDFPDASLDLLALAARHVERAFAAASHRLAQDRQAADIAILIYQESMKIKELYGTDPLKRHLMLRYGLTETEARLALATDGRSRKEYAKDAGVSVNTVKTHLRRIYAKLDVARHGELIIFIKRLSA